MARLNKYGLRIPRFVFEYANYMLKEPCTQDTRERVGKALKLCEIGLITTDETMKIISGYYEG